MALYTITVDAIALAAATAKTALEIGTQASDRAKIKQWSVEFDGVTSTNTPVKVEFQRASAAVTTATSLTAEKVDPADGPPSAVLKHSTTVEGAGTLSGGEIHRVPPTSGLFIQYPLGQEYVIPISSFFRIRLTAAQVVNATITLMLEE